MLEELHSKTKVQKPLQTLKTFAWKYFHFQTSHKNLQYENNEATIIFHAHTHIFAHMFTHVKNHVWKQRTFTMRTFVPSCEKTNKDLIIFTTKIGATFNLVMNYFSFYAHHPILRFLSLNMLKLTIFISIYCWEFKLN